jgi:hypothetical protein
MMDSKIDLAATIIQYRAELLWSSKCCRDGDLNCVNAQHHIGVARFHAMRNTDLAKKMREETAAG